jgi:PPK2 family polyphosphate:nucleotide phosphotransferase
MKTKFAKFRIAPGEQVDLRRRPTRIKPIYQDKKHYKDLLAGQVDELSTLQKLFFASDRHALLLVFQAMDAAGKDGVIRHVMSGVDPQGCKVVAFKPPSDDELHHDFLWRAACDLPGRGRIGIYNRSYYEEVLITRVHPDRLREEGQKARPALWRDRFRSIVDFERHLTANGTIVVKFFLHLSKREQRDRFLARIDEPRKNWKLDVADIEERDFWKDYRRAYEKCLTITHTADCPWYVIPADDKPNARLIVSGIILDTLKSLKLAYPRVSKKKRAELFGMRKKLARSDS